MTSQPTASLSTSASPSAGTYTTVQSVTLSTNLVGSEIWYTIDGSTPAKDAGTLYVGAITIDSDLTLKAIAVKDATSSTVLSATYNIQQDAGLAVALASGTYYDEQSVAISTSLAGAQIHYTVDGSTPTATHGDLYSSSVSIDRTRTLKACAFGPGIDSSNIISRTYTLICGTPLISSTAGTHISKVSIVIDAPVSTPGATLWYSTDGSTPTPSGASSTQYTAPFDLENTATLKVIAAKNNMANSAASSKAFTIVSADPSISLSEGTYNEDKTATLSTFDGATLRYTTTGIAPSKSSGTIWAGETITVDKTMTLKVIAYKAETTESAVQTRVYTMQVESPTPTILGNTFTSDQTVTLHVGQGATVKYTLDGSTPSASNGILYTSGNNIVLDNFATTLKTFAYRTDWTSSPVLTNTYTIKEASKRSFQAQNLESSSWYSVPTTKKASTAHVLVYVENTQTAITATQAQAAADEFENNIYNLIRDNFAYESDVDSNGKVILLLLDIKDGYTGTDGYVGGYFDATHLFNKTTYSNSNQCDMLFMDVNPAIIGSVGFNETMAHEFQHLINFANTAMVTGYAQDIWINEGLSSGAEFLYKGSQVTERIDWYNDIDSSETITQGNNFYVWNGKWETRTVNPDQLSNYSTVYLFFQWLQIHASNGTGIYKEILSSSFRDYRAVTNAASSKIDPSLSSWTTLLSTWYQANYLGKATGLQGYKGEITTEHWYYNSLNMNYSLAAGEGIVVAPSDATDVIPGTFAHPASGVGPNIRYFGMTFPGGVIDTTSPYVGNVILALNTNTVISATADLVVLPVVRSSGPKVMGNMVQVPSKRPTSWAITPPIKIGGGTMMQGSSSGVLK